MNLLPYFDGIIAFVLVVIGLYLAFWLVDRYKNGKIFPDPLSIYIGLSFVSMWLGAQRSKIPYAVAEYVKNVTIDNETVTATIRRPLYYNNPVSTVYFAIATIFIAFAIALGIFWIMTAIFGFAKKIETMD